MEKMNPVFTLQNATGKTWLASMEQQLTAEQSISFSMLIEKKDLPVSQIQMRALDAAIDALTKIRARLTRN